MTAPRTTDGAQVTQDTTGAHNRHQQIVSTALYVDPVRVEHADGIGRLIGEVFGDRLLPKRVPLSKIHCSLITGTRDVLSASERDAIGRCFDVVVYGFTKPTAPVQALVAHCPDMLIRSPGLAVLVVATPSGTNTANIRGLMQKILPGHIQKLPRKRWVTVRMRMGALCCVTPRRDGGVARYRCRFRQVH